MLFLPWIFSASHFSIIFKRHIGTYGCKRYNFCLFVCIYMYTYFYSLCIIQFSYECVRWVLLLFLAAFVLPSDSFLRMTISYLILFYRISIREIGCRNFNDIHIMRFVLLFFLSLGRFVCIFGLKCADLRSFFFSVFFPNNRNRMRSVEWKGTSTRITYDSDWDTLPFTNIFALFFLLNYTEASTAFNTVVYAT